MSLNNSELFLLKKCIHLSNSTFNLYVLYIELAQNTTEFRRLVQENFITVIYFLFGRKGFYGLKPWVFGLQNIFNPLLGLPKFDIFEAFNMGNGFHFHKGLNSG